MELMKIYLILLLSVTFSSCSQKTKSAWLGDLEIKSFSEGIPPVVGSRFAARDSILLVGKYVKRGVGVQSISGIAFQLDGNARQFSAAVGANDKGNKEIPVKFIVLGDKKILFESKELKPEDKPESEKVRLKGVKRLVLLITNNVEGHYQTYSNWTDAKMKMYYNNLPQGIPNDGEKYILRPKSAATPKNNSVSIFGARPNNPFLFAVAAVEQVPMTFGAENLPEGQSITVKTGIITGKVTYGGNFNTILIAKNILVKDKNELTIIIGDVNAITPSIGWNSWSREIDKEKVMVKSGLSNHGWTYVNIDDVWQGLRGGLFNALQPNQKFSKFREMIDEIHAKELKAYVYSTPWITSYAGYVGGSSNFENEIQIWLKFLQDGSFVFGLFNTDNFCKTGQSYFRWIDEKAKLYTFDFLKIGVSQKYEIHDVWRKSNLGVYDKYFKTKIPHDVAAMLKMSPKKQFF